jgi:RNA-directed DNA polymerase
MLDSAIKLSSVQAKAKDPNDLCKLLGVNSRNATFQKQLIKYLDEKFRPIAEKSSDVRLFTPAQKKKKLEEQGYKCKACGEPILEHQRNDGHHIISRCKGGRTDYENLEVLHKHCHEDEHHAD